MKYEFKCLNCNKNFAAFSKKSLKNIEKCIYCYSSNIERNYQFNLEQEDKDFIGKETTTVIEENRNIVNQMMKEIMEN